MKPKNTETFTPFFSLLHNADLKLHWSVVMNTKSFVYSFNTHGLFGLSAWFVNLLLCARVSGHRPKAQAEFEVERGGAGTRFSDSRCSDSSDIDLFA